MKIHDQIVIHAPIDQVFTAFTDLSNMPERIKGIEKIEILHEPAVMQVGTKWRETRTMFGKQATEEMWVTDLQPQQSYQVEAESNGVHYTSNYDFAEQDGSTLVKMTFVGKPLNVKAKLFSFMLVIFAGATKKALHQDLEDLKIFCEK